MAEDSDMQRSFRVTIYPRFDVYYYSFYLQGLRRLFSPQCLSYATRGFPRLGSRGLAFVMHTQGEHRIYICGEDRPSLNQEALEWCDLYAKVNIDPDSAFGNPPGKIIAIGPSFGLRIHSLLPAIYNSLRTYDTANPHPREHFANYYRQWRYRLPEEAYEPGASSDDYIFFVGSLWKRDTETNRNRASFIRACRTIPGLKFEGGFAPRTSNDVPGFDDVVIPSSYPIREYIRRTKASAVVFNTPAVSQCHGWKLGEFLALGKAIISTPLTGPLPTPLIHGEQIHYVDGSPEEIRTAVQLICRDSTYRCKLELGAREYYLKYLSPVAVMRRIIKSAIS